MSVRVRFAPSPTGYLHIGGARTALFNWALARQNKEDGTFVLRIEDTDEARSTPEYEAIILREMRWLGMTWDEGPEQGGAFGPYRQSDRADIYRAKGEQLLAAGNAYRCTCTEARLDALREEQKAAGKRPGYDGHCRNANLGPDCGPHVIRLRVPAGSTHVDDMVKGPVTFDNAELDDLILVRSDGTPTYNFVVVVDDVMMGMTHVLRGDDHLNNTPKQILIYQALGAPLPRFGHMPMILGPDGTRLSKRHGATSVGLYRDMGFHPEALLNYLARLGWSHGDLELFSAEEFIQHFSVDNIGKSAGKWDMDKLTWCNAWWNRTLPVQLVAERVLPFLLARNAPPTSALALEGAVLALRERSKTLVELADSAAFFFQQDAEVVKDEAAIAQFLTPDARQLLSDLADRLGESAAWTEAALEATVQAFVTEKGLKLGKIAQPIRVALSGQKVGPGLYQSLVVLGKENSLRRLKNAWQG